MMEAGQSLLHEYLTQVAWSGRRQEHDQVQSTLASRRARRT